MSRMLGVVFCLLLALPAIGQNVEVATASLSAIELVRAVETQYQGDTAHGKMQMHIKTRSWTRTLEMESWSEGRDKMLAKILSPVKERGICTLKVNDDIWNYMPRIDRLIKIPSSLMGDSWMGSHLTNDDLVKENKIDMLYDLKITSQDNEKISITGIPLPDAAVVWGKIVYTIDSVKLVPIEIDYFDEAGDLVRKLSFTDVQKNGARWLPNKMRIQPLEKPEEYTELTYLDLKFNVELSADLFSIKSLRNR